MSFIQEFSRLQKKAFDISKAHGFHESDAKYSETRIKEQISQRLMLTVSELSEALEAIRHDNPPDSHIPKFTGLEAEMADAVIRLLDLAETTNSRLGAAIVAKMAYNHKRPMMNGGGKKF